MSQVELAARLGVKQPSLSNWESGRREPSAENYLKLAEIAGPPDDHYFARCASPTTRNPYQEKPAPARSGDLNVFEFSREIVPHPKSTILFRAADNAMSPRIEPGDLVAVDTQVPDDRRRLRNRIVLARGPDGVSVLRHLRRSGTEETLVAYQTGDRFPPVPLARDSRWTIIGVVIFWIGRPPA